MDYGDVSFSYIDLRDRANRLARFFSAKGIKAGSHVGLLLDRSLNSYASVLALSKIGAAYVPLDASFPPDRICFILEDSSVNIVVTLRGFAARFADAAAIILALDDHYGDIERLPPSPFEPEALEGDEDPLSYIIYTSGTTGKPKGVPIRQSSICNFLHIAARLYGYTPGDRVFQGMTIAFDFSVEELWVPLIAGATLVPAPSQAKLLGSDLKDFLISNRVTALCCVPTMLATLEPDLPLLRFLLVSGEACPADVIARWFAPGRRVLNAYGPTETTVTATWSVLSPGKAVTIGGPLPTYTVIILDPETGEALGEGQPGEICIAGIGLSDGYLNRPEQTAKAFIPDFIGLPDNRSGKIYRTGDLGRIASNNEIEFLGRIDTQVKIRGYRIELDEIEAVARSVEGIAQAVVQPFDPDGSSVELVAYLMPATPGTKVDAARVDAALRAALPAYMVPSFYEQLDIIPLLPSTKVDRKALPAPVNPRFVAAGTKHVEPRNAREAELAMLLADVLKLEKISVESNFFDELGADSLKLASYVTAIRKQLGIRRISMRQLYQHPSIAELSAVLEAAVAEPGAVPKAAPQSELIPVALPEPSVAAGAPNVAAATEAPNSGPATPCLDQQQRAYQKHGASPHIATDAARIATGAAQMGVYALALFVTALASVIAYDWVSDAPNWTAIYVRAALATSIIYFGGSATLIAIKWLAVGRFTTEPIPLWTTKYLRFWIARTVIHANPLNLLAGTPLYTAYLRLLGMRVGSNTLILSLPPVCTDLVSIGDNSVIRHDSVFPGYTAHNGYIYPGTISIGSDVLICEATVLDINTAMGDGSQLGTTSALLEGQVVPAGAKYQGSPAEPATTNYNRVAPVPVSAERTGLYAASQVLSLALLSLPASVLSAVLVTKLGISTTDFINWPGAAGAAAGLAAGAAVFYFGSLLLGMITVIAVPRLLNHFFRSEVVHPIYGLQYQLARSITRLSNNRILNTLFGDSSMILKWLSAVGYDLTQCTQTGSNFGVDQRHHSPFLCVFNRNTLVSDGLLMMNMETSSSSFILRQVTMPPDTYVGNVVHYPADSRLGDNCLIATKAAIPIDGPIRSEVGILGSPPFEIPRSVARDQKFDHFKQPGILETQLALKLRSNLVTLGLYLLRSWALAFLGFSLTFGAIAYAGANGQDEGAVTTAMALAAASLAFVAIAALFSILCERMACRFKRLEPQYCSLYDPIFWNHERFWKLNYNAFLRVFDGTPLKPVFLRLQGAKVGRGVFDDGCGLTEPSMVEIGDHCMLNFRSTLQCHSLEDGTFKSGRIGIGNNCTIGTNSFVHYGSVMQDGAVLEADAFLMKGSVVEAETRWFGNPARDSAAAGDAKLRVEKGGKKW